MSLYRVALMYARDGVVLARSTMCGWHEQLADQAERFVRVGEEVSEVLERRPASMVAVRIVRPKFIARAAASGLAAPADAAPPACDEPPRIRRRSRSFSRLSSP